MPYGDYQRLRLVPVEADAAASFGCDEAAEGTMYYNQTSGQVMVCRKKGTGYEWQTVGLWTQTNTSIHPDQTDWKVAIGRNEVNSGGAGDGSKNRPLKVDVGDSTRGNNDGFMATDDVYLKDPLFGPPRWASEGAAGDFYGECRQLESGAAFLGCLDDSMSPAFCFRPYPAYDGPYSWYGYPLSIYSSSHCDCPAGYYLAKLGTRGVQTTETFSSYTYDLGYGIGVYSCYKPVVPTVDAGNACGVRYYPNEGFGQIKKACSYYGL